MREAGALALSMFRTEFRTWTKGGVVAGLRSRHRGQRPDPGAIAVGDARITAGCRKKASKIPRGSASAWSGSSIRSTARAAISPAAKTGASARRWSKAASPLMAAVFAPATDEFFFAARGQGATCNGEPIRATSGTGLDFSQHRGPEAAGRTAGARQRRTSPCIRESVRWRCGCAGSPMARLDAAFAGGQSRDWDLAAADLIVHEAGGTHDRAWRATPSSTTARK